MLRTGMSISGRTPDCLHFFGEVVSCSHGAMGIHLFACSRGSSTHRGRLLTCYLAVLRDTRSESSVFVSFWGA